MLESNDNETNIAGRHHEGGSSSNGCCGYAASAREAYEKGDRVLAMHLYLTAYEAACKGGPAAHDAAAASLRAAWNVACELHERSIAEYVYDKLEPYLDADETGAYAAQLQSMALDKLSEFGISRSDLEDMADMISDEIGASAHITGIAPIISSTMSAAASERAPEAAAGAPAPDGAETSADVRDSDAQAPAALEPDVSRPRLTPRPSSFAELVGFDAAVEDVRALGIGIKDDDEYRLLMDTLRVQHGIDGLSAAGSIVFRTSSREDAGMLMSAVAGELGLPTLRVQMQPGPQGLPALCVTTAADRPVRMNNNRLSLETPGVLVLEDIDMWGAPLIEAASATEGEGIVFASMSRAAREAFGLIGSAVENPDVYVLASIAGDTPDQGYLYDLMEPMNIVDLYLPDEVERRQVWNAIALEHPSVRTLDLSRLTRVSRNLSRFDIVSAGREAVEDAYRRGLKERRYIPVSQSMMFEHIANFQPLESEEYRFLEEAVASEFRARIGELEDCSDDADARGKGGR